MCKSTADLYKKLTTQEWKDSLVCLPNGWEARSRSTNRLRGMILARPAHKLYQMDIDFAGHHLSDRAKSTVLAAP